MDIYDQILENLELERELGTRLVEIDRALLVPPKPPPVPRPEPAPQPESAPAPAKRIAAAETVPVASAPVPPPSAAPGAAADCDILFLTGCPLSPAGMEAMDKTFAAMRRIKPDIKVALNEDRRSRVVIFLGKHAVEKYIPGIRGVRGRWIEFQGRPALMTFSPDYIFANFQKDSVNMRKAKYDMWEDVKSAIACLRP